MCGTMSEESYRKAIAVLKTYPQRHRPLPTKEEMAEIWRRLMGPLFRRVNDGRKEYKDVSNHNEL